ncbi:hypothetical protein RHGRI_016950 [Rhododendron griersonianum]|uniref:CCHC-type domain-containing protein n=1 Tax=Rhododendron griersonianum TaxID=479676 RepID=A0AAV6JW31_9ERIC|nr:hypothetical protein RHGRI_016950 [Rhododendron griersonianum]
MSRNEVTRISSCVTAKEAWEILRTSHEGEPLSDLKVCRKILRSLPERFRVKVTAIEERPDVDNLIFAELVGKLQIFEINHLSDFKPSKSSTGIAFKSTHEDTLETCEDDDDLSDEEITKFAKKFKKFFKRRNDLGKSHKPSSNLMKNTLGNDDKRPSFDKSRKPQGIQCHECHGFGHIQSECANTLKKKMKKGLKVTWDDDSGDDDSESGFQIGGEWNSSASVLVATVDSPISPKLLSISSSSSLESIESDKSSAELKIARNVDNEGEEFEIESIHEAYDLMYQDYMKQGKKKKELETSIKVVEKEKMSLREDLINISQELDELKKYNAKLVDKFANIEKERLEGLRELEKANFRINELERDLSEASEAIKRNDCGATRIAEMTRTFRDKSGLGFIDPPSLKTKSSENKTLVSTKAVVNSPSSSNSKPIVNTFFKKRVLTCHHCGVEGHIRPNCYRLRRELQKKGQTQRSQKRFIPRSVVLGQPNVERPRNTTLMQPKALNNDFLAQLNCLATQSSYIVKEIDKLTLLAKDMNGASLVHNKLNQVWKKVDRVSCVVQPLDTPKEFRGSTPRD